MRVKWRKRNILSLNFLAELTFSLNKTTSNLLGQLQIRFIYVSLFKRIFPISFFNRMVIINDMINCFQPFAKTIKQPQLKMQSISK